MKITKREVFNQIIHEVTDHQKSKLQGVVDDMVKLHSNQI